VSVCKFWGCDPNEVGNLCIAGHNYRNSRFFSKVPNLVVGDTIEITDLTGKTITYSVYDKYTVDPSDVSCTTQLTNGKKIVTLITCTNDSKQRVVVKAEEI
jgi:LPXTG-site transpeptidase (sortase) family protein